MQKKHLVRISNSLLLVALTAVVSMGQPDEKLLLWESRANSISDQVSVETNKLTGYEKGMNLARLAEIWWNRLPERGQRQLAEAVEYSIRPAAIFEDNTERLNCLRDLLKIVAPKDADLTKRLITRLIKEAEEMGPKDDDATSEAIVQAAIALVDLRPTEAFELVSLTLKKRRPYFSFSSMMFCLKAASKNGDLSNRLFSDAVDAARRHSDVEIFDKLVRLAFPEAIQANHGKVISEIGQRKLLDALTLYFRSESLKVLEGRRTECKLTSFYAPRLREQYDEMLPERLTIVDVALTACKVSRPGEPTQDTTKTTTLDELIEEAEKTLDKRTKARLLLEAATLAVSGKRYTLAFDLLLKIDEENRSVPPGLWQATMIGSAVPIVIDFIGSDDFSSADNLISRVPGSSAPLVRIAVADRLSKGLSQKQLVNEMLASARKQSAKLDFPTKNDASLFFLSPEMYCDMIAIYRKVGMEIEALETHDESIIAVNRYLASFDAETKRETLNSMPIKWERFSNYQGVFFEQNYMRIESSISSIADPPTKLRVRFAWLRATIKKWSEVEVELSKKVRPSVRSDRDRR